MFLMFSKLVHKTPDFGLKADVQECKQWGPVPSQTALAPGVQWVSSVKVLGVPVGLPGFIQNYFRKVLSKLQGCLRRLNFLWGCAFAAFHILRSCLSACKVKFLLRTLPDNFALGVATEAPERLRTTLADERDMPQSIRGGPSRG